jgi:electron transfer flavoprotein beta subunit
VRIAICVKEVPDPTAAKRIDEGTMRLVRSGENTLNPYDRHAIEAAVQIKEGPAPDTEITIVTVGPESAGRSVDRALAQGGDQSVHVADEAAAGSDLLGTARILAAALKRGGYDLILLGQQAADSECYVIDRKSVV